MKKFIIYYIPLIIVFLSIENVSSQKLATPQTDYLKQGIANLKEENYEEAVEDLKNARKKNPNSSLEAYLLGIAFKKVQNYSDARVHLKDALTLTPPTKEAATELSDVLYQLGENEQALNELESAEKIGLKSAQTVFLKGLILSKLGKNPEAIESFQKAKSLDEKLTASADYQIAMVNLQDGRLNEARDILKEIVIRDPNADIAQFANQYIDAITKRLKEARKFKFAAGIQYQNDSNVILKPSDATVAGNITGESDSSGIATLRGEYTPKLRAPYNFKAQYSFYQNLHNRLKIYDVQSHSINLVPGSNLPGGSITLLTGYNYTLVDNNNYLQTITLSPAYTFIINKIQFIQTSIKYQSKDYLKTPANSDEDRDGANYNGGISWFYLISGNNGFLNMRYEFDKEDTAGKNWIYSGNKLGLSLLYPIMEKLNLNAGGEMYLQGFENIHTTFNKKRDDKLYNLNTMLTYRIYEDVDIQLQYIYMQADSNISVYGYNKNMLTLGIEARF